LCLSLQHYREGRPARAVVTFGEPGTRYPGAIWPDCWQRTCPMCAACWQTTPPGRYNIGGAPYGYVPERIPHPNPAKAAQGRTKTRLVLDPVRAPVVEQIFTWRTVDKLGVTTITDRLNADPGRCPSPKPGGWTTSAVYAILRNPKYTGHMVYGRRRSASGRRHHYVPQDQWIWSPEQTHPRSSPAPLGTPRRPSAPATPAPAISPAWPPTPPPAAVTCLGRGAGTGTASAG